MKKSPLRLLCIVGSMDAGGAETFLMKVYRELDKSKFQMDFYVSASHKGVYEDEIIRMGGRIFKSIPKSKGFLKSFNNLVKVVKRQKYHYVMRVSQHSISTLDLLAAKMGGAKVLIYRSSNSNTGGGKLNRFLHKSFLLLPIIFAKVKIAPSTEAGIFMFGKRSVKKKQVNIIKNGIPIKSFIFDINKRKNIRNKLNLDDNVFLVGHVGRFTSQKNHTFLLEVFSKIIKNNKNSRLLLIGIGELENKVKERIKDLGLEEKVIFLGVRNDVPDLMMGMDCFIFPSLYEGMPNTVVEAQATGLPCLISDAITKEVEITPLIKFMSLNESSEIWAENALQYTNKDIEREKINKQFDVNGYDIKQVVNKFTEVVFLSNRN